MDARLTGTKMLDQFSSIYSRSGGTYLAAAGGLVKIGRSKDIDARILALRIGNPAIRLLAFSADERFEALWHVRFRALHVEGEWFRPNQDLVTLIEDLRRDFPPRPAPVKKPRAAWFGTRASTNYSKRPPRDFNYAKRKADWEEKRVGLFTPPVRTIKPT